MRSPKAIPTLRADHLTCNTTKQRRGFWGSAVVYKSQFADCASYLPRTRARRAYRRVADRHVGVNSPRSQETPVRSPLLLLKRLNRGNTLIEGCLSTTDLNESIFHWIRGNHGWRQDMRIASEASDQTMAAERASSRDVLTSCRGMSWKPVMEQSSGTRSAVNIYRTSSRGK